MAKSLGVCGPMWASETAKIREKVLKYCQGKVVDIGCGTDKITPDAIGVDFRATPAVSIRLGRLEDIYRLSEVLKEHVGTVDAVFSSHCLEHIPSDFEALRDWIKLLKVGASIVLYLPDDRFYDNLWNVEHFHCYYYEVFKRRFEAFFGQSMRVVESGGDVGDDRYSFFIVAQKA